MKKKFAKAVLATIATTTLVPLIPVKAQDMQVAPITTESFESRFVEIQPHAFSTVQTTQATPARDASGVARFNFARGAVFIVNTLQVHQFVPNGPQYVLITSGAQTGRWVRRAHLTSAPGIIPY